MTPTGPTTTVRAVRGATTVDQDTPEDITERVVALLVQILERNGLVEDDIISILFTATDDIVSTFPATAARSMGLGAVPLICARELSITGAVDHCIRVMLHVTTERPRDEIHHVYLEGAQGLRDDLPD
jgi:chorismate mutase